MLKTDTDKVQVKGQTSNIEDVALRRGLHFPAVNSAGSIPVVPFAALFDHVVNMAEKFDKAVQGKDAIPPESKWPSASQPEKIPFRRSEGGLQISDFGLQIKGHGLKIYLAAVALSPLKIALNGLILSLNFSNIKLPHISTLNPPLSLQGLGLGYRRGGITMVGELTPRPSSSEKAHEDFYGGAVIIGTSKYTFTAAGAYDRVLRPGEKDSYESLFVFGIMKGFVMEFGYMEVTGTRVVFWVQFSSQPPDADRVQEFAFFELAKQNKSDPLQALYQLNDNKAIGPK